MEALPLIFLMSLIFFAGGEAATFTLSNKCSYTVWPGLLTSSGSRVPTGYTLNSGASTTLTVAAPWSGRVWGRTGCATDNTGKFKCATADCASGQVACNNAGAIPPASLAEFTLAANKGQDYYDISLVDGFNLPLSITPQGGSGGCQATSCPKDINTVCPSELAVKGTGGGVIACKSACVAFNKPEYCCTGSFNTPDKCPPTNYSKIFKGQCPQAYSYAYDDKSSTFTCTGGANYLITFCP